MRVCTGSSERSLLTDAINNKILRSGLNYTRSGTRVLLAQNDDGLYKWAHTSKCKFHNFKASLQILMAALDNLKGRRILYMHLRAKLLIYFHGFIPLLTLARNIS